MLEYMNILIMNMSEEFESEGGAPLNLYQRYRHTVRLDKTTSRMNNKDWYRDALDLDVQLHCYVHDETEVDCYLHVKSRHHYEEIGRLNFKQLEAKGEQEVFIQQILQHKTVQGAKTKSLGVVFYLADEFSIAGLGPEHENPDELAHFRTLMLTDPREVLEDKTVSNEIHAWRMFPYRGGKHGNEFATAVAVPRKLDGLLRSWREYGEKKNFPIRTSALSAPLCAVASLPWCASPSPQGTIAIFNYRKFTILAFFNSACDLVMLRHIAHSQGAGVPRNLGPAVFSAATAFELETPEIYVLPMTGVNVDSEILSLQTAMKESTVMLVQTSDILTSRGISLALPLELLTATHQLDPQVYPLAGNQTFSEFQAEAWPYQDFLPPSHEELSRTPDAGAMQLLKLSRLVKVVAVLSLAGVILFAGMGIMKQITSDTWHAHNDDSQQQLKVLQNRLNKFQKWDILLKDRSKAWVCMELLSQLVPDDGSIVLTDVRHDVKLKQSEKSKTQWGIEKNWKIDGLTGDKGMLQLEDYNALDGQKMKELFRRVAKATGNEAYWPDHPERDLTVKFSHKSGGARGAGHPVGGSLSRSFTLTITQTFSKNDPMTLNTLQ